MNQQNLKSAFQYIEEMCVYLPFPVYWIDPKGYVLGKNDLAMQFFDFASDDHLLGKTLFDLYPEKMADNITRHNMEVMQTGEIYSQEESLVDREGKRWEFDAMKIPVKNSDGAVIGLIVIPNTDTDPDISSLVKKTKC